jgi:hypothetical protein
MGMNKFLKGSSKAQLMTVIMLILFLLILAELFTLALLNITSDATMQSFSLSFSSSNYGNLLRLSANNFAKESLRKAIFSLATYEYNATLRKGNLISNTSLYISNMMISGILPNDLSGYPQNAMGNLTLAIYNSSIASLLNFAVQPVAVNETRPVIFQPDPYHIGVSYTERISINSSGNNYRYSIPVNVSIPINNTPDLLYAQQGVLRNIKFANLTNVTSVIGNAYATSGNSVTYAYGTIYSLPSSSTGGATCPSSSSYSPMNKNTILATYNAIGLESCMNNYAGLISYIAPSSTPAVPYLIYPASTNVVQSLQSGQKVLLYGPGYDTLNIEGLRTAIMNGYYFSSPFASSYLNIANDNFNIQSPNGFFTFSNYNTQSANFNSAINYVQANPPGSLTGSFTVVGWGNPATTATMDIVGTRSPSDDSFDMKFTGGNKIHGDIGTGSAWITNLADASFPYSTNTLYQVAYAVTPTGYTIYVNGVQVGSGTLSGGTPLLFDANHHVFIGQAGNSAEYFNGAIANIQIYNSALLPSQIQQLYQEGIEGLPLSGNLVGWWPLNGNSNDYSGNGNNGAATAVSYGLLQNYNRDSIFNTPVSTPLSPLPGVLSCNSKSQCASNSLPHLFLGFNPLEQQNAYVQTAYFNGAANVLLGSGSAFNVNGLTITAWVKETARGANAKIVSRRLSNNDYYMLGSSNGQPYGGIGNVLSQNQISDPVVMPLNEWHFLAFTSNSLASNIMLYYDGNMVVSSLAQEPVGNLAGVQVSLGSDFQGVSNYFTGYVSDVQLYSTPLNQQQVTQLYSEGILGLPIPTNLIAWYPLDGNANDYSLNGNNGTSINVAYPYMTGNYYRPGLSTISTSSNEWQALGLANT